MAKKFMQINMTGPEEYKTASTDEYVNLLTAQQMSSIVIYGLGIYALPGTKFKIFQQANTQATNPVIINNLGVFQIDLEENPIFNISVNKRDIAEKQILVDIIYQEGVNTNE